MKKIVKGILSVTLGTLVIILIVVFEPQSAVSKITTNVPSDISGEEMQAVVIEDFEKGTVGGNGWLISSTPRKYNKKSSTETAKKRKDPVPTLEMKFVKGGPNDLAVEKWSLSGLGKVKEKCLGVHFRFRYPGFNSISIETPLEVSWRDKKPVYSYDRSLRKNIQERGLQLPGKSKAISLWVHARGNPYTLELWLKDWKGNTHVLSLGSIDFVGWRPLKVYIPSNIPQEISSYPQTKVTKITRFVIRSSPYATSQDVYFFFDQLKVLTDTYEVNFDGMTLDKQFNSNSGKSNGNNNK